MIVAEGGVGRLMHVIPALHGELLLLRKKGYEAPEIGYEISTSDGDISAEFEAAWPARKECMLIDNSLNLTKLAGWNILQLGDVARA